MVAIFSPDAKLFQITKGYTQANPGMDEDQVFAALERLRLPHRLDRLPLSRRTWSGWDSKKPWRTSDDSAN